MRGVSRAIPQTVSLLSPKTRPKTNFARASLEVENTKHKHFLWERSDENSIKTNNIRFEPMLGLF